MSRKSVGQQRQVNISYNNFLSRAQLIHWLIRPKEKNFHLFVDYPTYEAMGCRILLHQR
jgi:hypothetical protein